MEEISRTLPEGVEANTVYDRTDARRRDHRHGQNNLLEGAVLVIVVLFLLLGNFRAALIAAASFRSRCSSPSPGW